MGDDHFQDFAWEAAGRFVCGTYIWKWTAEQATDVGLSSAPNDPHPSREVYAYGANDAEVRIVCVRWRVTIPSTEDITPLEGPPFLAVGGFVFAAGVSGASE